jgi:hypothetical protein
MRRNDPAGFLLLKTESSANSIPGRKAVLQSCLEAFLPGEKSQH